jgi:hypothetical protein
MGKWGWYSIRFSSFLLYSVLFSSRTVETVTGCVSFKKKRSKDKAGAEFLDEIQKKVLRVFLLAIHIYI